MKKISQMIVHLALTAGAAYAAYQFLLDDRAKKSLLTATKKTVDAVGKSASKVSDLIEDRMGAAGYGASTKEEADLAWERLGY